MLIIRNTKIMRMSQVLKFAVSSDSRPFLRFISTNRYITTKHRNVKQVNLKSTINYMHETRAAVNTLKYVSIKRYRKLPSLSQNMKRKISDVNFAIFLFMLL